MNLSPRTTEALFQVVDIHHEGRALREDVDTVAMAFQHPSVRRYAQEFVGVDVDMEEGKQRFDPVMEHPFERSHEDFQPESSGKIKDRDPTWEELGNELASLNPHPRAQIHSLFQGDAYLTTPRADGRRLTPRATTPKSFSQGSILAQTPREYSFKSLGPTPRQNAANTPRVVHAITPR